MIEKQYKPEKKEKLGEKKKSSNSKQNNRSVKLVIYVSQAKIEPFQSIFHYHLVLSIYMQWLSILANVPTNQSKQIL